MKKEGLKIISLDVTNIRRVTAFKMLLDGNNLHIAGDVSEGKTTAINALWEILTKSSDSMSHGKRKGVIKIRLAGGEREILAERVFTSKTSTVKISDEKGQKITAKEFNMMISTLAINPHKIKDMTPQAQVQALLKSAKVDIDLVELEQDISDKEEMRLALRRDADKAKPAGDEPSKVEKVSVANLIIELETAEVINTENAGKRSNLSYMENELANIKLELNKLQQKHDDMQTRVKEGNKTCDSLEDMDAQTIKGKIASTEEINDKAAAYEQWTKDDEEYNGYLVEWQRYDDAVKTLKEKKRIALETAQWPIEELSISAGEIYYKGNLLENLGESEQMLVCAALAMNDILAHEIRVVRMDGVESMSEEHMQTLIKMFNGHNIQVLSTRVSRGDIGQGEIEIVDGEYTDGQLINKPDMEDE